MVSVMNALRRTAARTTDSRRGTATVEFAIVAPIFLTLALGTWEMGNAVNASNNLTAAVREGGRLASMDFTGMMETDETPNEKVIRDVKAFVSAAGIPAAQVTVTITHADGANAGSTFDLANDDNYLGLFKIKATVPYSAISNFPTQFLGGQTLRAELVCRRGRVSNSE